MLFSTSDSVLNSGMSGTLTVILALLSIRCRRFLMTRELSHPVYALYIAGFISLMSTIQWSIRPLVTLINTSGTFKEVSMFIFQLLGQYDLKCRISLHDNRGSPPPKVTPPPVARKYKSSFFTLWKSSSGVKRFHTLFGDSACGFRQYLQLSGQPWKATSVVTPAPSTPIRCLLSPMRADVFI